MSNTTVLAIVLAGVLLQAVVPGPVEVDPALAAAVERFIATQQAEDADGYLALWSEKGARPQRQQLQYVFDSGDDLFSDLRITHAVVSGDTARVRIAVRRARTDTRVKGADGGPRVFPSELRLTLTYAREAGEWKLLREGPPTDELALALLAAGSAGDRQTLLAAEPELADARLIDSLGRQADPLSRTHRYAEARAIYAIALEVAAGIADRKREGQALQNIGNTYYYERNMPRAREAYETRLALERDRRDDEGIAGALVGIATLDYTTHEYGAALKGYREALEIQERLGDLSLVATTLISTGNVRFIQGDFEAAIADYSRAEALKRKVFDPVGATAALEGLARTYAAQGDFGAALSAFTSVLEERRRLRDTGREGLVLQSIGEVHMRLGNSESARSALADGLAIFRKGGAAANAGWILQFIAMNELLAGQTEAGEKAYAESMATCAPVPEPECVARAQVGLAFALAAQEQYAPAIEWYRKAIDGFTSLSQPEAAARAQVGLGEALSRDGKHEDALEVVARARQTAIALENDDLLWRAILTGARAERRLGRTADAMGAAKAAVLAVERMAKAAEGRPGARIPRDALSAFAALAILQAETGDATAAFETAEAMRAHALRASLAPHEREIARPLTAGERAEERRLDVELTTRLVQRDRERGLAKPDAARIERLTSAIEAATARREAWRRMVFERYPDLASWRGLGSPARAADLHVLIDDPSALLLSLVVDEQDIVLITVRRGSERAHTVEEVAFTAAMNALGVPWTFPPPLEIQAHVVAIERRTLGERVAAALERGSLDDTRAWQKASAPLFDLLPGTVVERLRSARRIYISADDLLWRVPFEALPTGAGYLADQATVIYVPSLTAVARPLDADGGAGQTTLAVVAPEIPAATLESLRLTAPSWTVRPAEAGQREADALPRRGGEDGPNVLSGAEATADAFRHALPGAAHVHVAAPFRLNAAGPLFSAMLLAPDPPDEGAPAGDGRFEIREVFDQASPAQVVLFSDPAALSMRDAAAALPPVAWGWRVAGVPALIVRRWAGDDETAALLLSRVHEELAKGRTPEEALHAAQSFLRGRPEGRAPLAWAGWLALRSAGR